MTDRELTDDELIAMLKDVQARHTVPASPKQFDVKWEDLGREPQVSPNPDYPNGKDVDGALGATQVCVAPLPYPAKRIGNYWVTCLLCGRLTGCTTAGRTDDPRSLRMACNLSRV